MVSRSQTAKYFLAYFSRNIRHADPLDQSFCSDRRNRCLKRPSTCKARSRRRGYLLPRTRAGDRIVEMTAHTNKSFKYLLVAAIAAGTPKNARKMKSVIKKQVFVFAQVWPRAVEPIRSWNRRYARTAIFWRSQGSTVESTRPKRKLVQSERSQPTSRSGHGTSGSSGCA